MPDLSYISDWISYPQSKTVFWREPEFRPSIYKFWTMLWHVSRMPSLRRTPSRRKREDSDDDESDYTSSGSGASPAKRQKNNSNGSRNARESSIEPTMDVSGKHQPGAIVRVRLRNFVTYKDATFEPGPTLNMVIGPNGNGKSTLVCAICLGLGWGSQVSAWASNKDIAYESST